MTNTPKTRIGIKVSKQGPLIPYLSFADNCMISCKANRYAAIRS